MDKSSERKFAVVLSYANIIIKNLIVFLYTPFLLKYLGQSEYGIYQMTNSVIMGLSVLSMGFSGSYVRFYMKFKNAKERKSINSLNGMYLLLFLGMALLSLLIGSILVVNTKKFFGASFTGEQVHQTKVLMGILVLNIALTFPSTVFDCNILANEKLKFQQARQVAQTILVPIISIPLIIFGAGSEAIVITQTGTTFLLLIMNANFAITKLNMRFSFKSIPIDLLKEVSVFSFFIFLSQVIDLVNNNVPSFIVGMFLGAKDVAVYSVASQIKNLFFMLSVGLSGVYVPHINELVSSGTTKKTLLNLMIKVGRMQLILLTFILGGFIAIGKYFIVTWAGKDNIQAYYLLILMIFPVLVPLSQNVGIEIQRAMNKHYFRSIIYSIFALINIGVTVLSVIKLGLVGSIFGYTIATVCANGVAMNWYYQKKMGLDMKIFWKNIISVFVPFVISTSIVFTLSNFMKNINIWIFILLGLIYSILYIAIYLRISATDSELSNVKNLINHIKR
ncbi:oligosaccharide flippase family protein [Enterococcus raffinosus]|uniref:lipopolysaccharide biosynthesis protein n=1 Tax=Enterococcus raffinosus TaxID=71452 RepID=UPI001C10EF2C|nr:oligosaccharide flippase family protein [Enterococcus raffinosus]MBU5360856.1 oligosaccharide flippase family protein [Enterococcus raffinosus]